MGFRNQNLKSKIGRMARLFSAKRESLESIIESLACYKCDAMPGPNGDGRNRYSCVDNSHSLCESCKTKCKCGSSVGKCPNPIFQKMLAELPVPWFCQHYQTGCRENFLRPEWIDDH